MTVPLPLPKSVLHNLVLLVSIYSIFSFPLGHAVAAYVLSFVYPSLRSFPTH